MHRGAQHGAQVWFGGMALCDRNGGHIAVDLFQKTYPPLMNRIIDIFSALLGAVIFAFIAWAVWESAKLSQMLNLSTNLLRLPKVWFQWGLCGFAVLTALGMLLRAVELTLSRRDVRGEWSIYHNNAIQTWHVKEDGVTENVQVG